MNRKDRKFFDEAFAEVFTNRKIIESLLRDFVKEKWVNMIDFSTLEVEKSVFKGISDSKRESDILLKFDLENNNPAELFIFILLEFQSKPEAMILRLFEYLSRIYKKQYIELKSLFPVIPIVIYNGKERWNEKSCFVENLSVCTDEMKKYIPDFKYILIDIARFDEDLLDNLKDSVSYFFLLDKTDLGKREEASLRIIGILKELQSTDLEIFTLLGRYITELLDYKRVEINSINSYINDRGESMLAQSLDDLYEDGIEKGLEKGKQESLILLLEKKFGLNDADKQLILSNDNPDNLNDALEIILFASTKDEILDVFNKDK
ncbi:MAG: Rpn family recombination-promoting nuclease/putative transposase [Spirochaetaceae bacterium]|jgi:predicted transposase/invertase (TIGR01784 family)|nr:Rpn family recombination-promoting nuclease/putative transposase [Spirochaetaceae bacterium]